MDVGLHSSPVQLARLSKLAVTSHFPYRWKGDAACTVAPLLKPPFNAGFASTIFPPYLAGIPIAMQQSLAMIGVEYSYIVKWLYHEIELLGKAQKSLPSLPNAVLFGSNCSVFTQSFEIINFNDSIHLNTSVCFGP